MKLEPRATTAGMRVIAHEVLGSTNAEALNLARRGERGPLWVIAERQSACRGRRGCAWVSQPGNLYASLLLTDPASAEHWPELSFVAALAVHDAIAEVAPALAPLLAIKWPNDLLLAGAKVAGVLLEGEGGKYGALVVGVGVNCANHPADMEQPATDLAAAGAPVAPATLLGALARTMLGRIAQWNAGKGFAAIRANWLARATGVGGTVRVRLADRELVGRFEALDPAGGLVLRLPDDSATTIAAGDVFMPPSPVSGLAN
jgi:BirA family transcriptional regulator, biotin operon repressor / biotin---[acetyl-CoA-carboxylase] ligase